MPQNRIRPAIADGWRAGRSRSLARSLFQGVGAERIASCEVRYAARRQLVRERAQRRPQTFLDRRMVERHAQEVVNGELAVDGQRQHVRHVLGRGSGHLGAEQAPVAVRRAEPQEPAVLLHCSGTPLRGEVDLARQNRLRVPPARPLADDCHLGVAENNG